MKNKYIHLKKKKYWGGRGEVGGKCRQLSLNNNKIIIKKKGKISAVCC